LSPPARVLVTGATGFVGSHFARGLLRAGHLVRVLARDPSKASSHREAGAEVATGTLEDPASLRRAVGGVDSVVHCAALLSSPDRVGYARINAEGTRSLLEAAIGAGCRAFLLVSSLAAAGPARGGRPVRREDEPRPVSDYGWSKLEAEGLLREASGRIRTCAIRPPIVYGPGDRGMLPFFRAAARGIAPRIGRVRSIDLIHVADLCGALLAVLERPLPTGSIHFVRGEGRCPPERVLELAASAFGSRLRRIRIPSLVAVAVAAGADLLARLRRGGSGVVFGYDKWREMREEAWTCDDSAFRTATGWAPRISLEEGVEETARWYLEKGWVRAGRVAPSV
jgi:nucleoside-diphosphate-sugar epimerase